VARPRPRRAWVRPAGSRAHQYLHRVPTGTKAGSQQRVTSPRGGSPHGATRWKGEPAHRASGATRVRRDARRRGAGCSPALLADSSRTQTWREHWDDTAWGSHDPRLPLARRDAASPMGRRRRDALGHGRLEGTRTGRLRRGAVQEEGMAALVLTAGRRWSRCRLDVGGGAASRFTVVLCSGPALPRSRSPPSPSGSSLPRPAPAATRRRRRASVSRLASSSPAPPLLLSPSDGGSGKGQKPQYGLVAVALWRLPSPCF
jgi:hypothetical protein